MVTAASVSDKAGAKLLVIRLFDAFSTLKIMWADSGYDGRPLAAWTTTIAAITLEVVKRTAPHRFQVVRRRWVVEITYLALRHTLLKGRVLRSGDPAGLQQEMRALLALYQALQIAVSDAIATVPGTDPDRASYQIAVETAQTLVTGARNILTGVTDLACDIGRAVLASLHGPRRPRVCARRVKSPLSRWARHPPGKPTTCLQVTKITTEIRRNPQPTTTRRQQSLTPAPALNSPTLSLCWPGNPRTPPLT